MFKKNKTITNDIDQSRKLVWVTALIYVFWGVLHLLAFDSELQVFLEMVAVSCLMSTSILVSKFSKTPDHIKLNFTKVGRWILVTHYLSLVYRHDLSMSYAFSAIFLVFMCSSLFQTRRGFFSYALYVTLLSLYCGQGSHHESAFFFASAIASTLMLSYIALSSRLTLMNSLRNREALFSSMFLNSASGMIAVEDDGKISMVNDTMLNLLEVQYSEIIGQQLHSRVHPEDVEAYTAALAEFMNGSDQHFNLKLRFIAQRRGLIWVRATGTLIEANDIPRFAFFIFDDITKAIEDDALIESQKQKMIHASKMAALGEMSGSLAHEINTPLAVIAMTAQNLMNFKSRGKLTDEFMDDAFATLTNTVDRISKIVVALRKFSRDPSHATNELVVLKDVISDSLSLSRESFLMAGIDLKVDPIPENLLVSCRAIELSQVLINLLNNSKDSIRHNETRWVRIGIHETHQFAIISVEDSGTPIPEEIRSKIFQPLYTTKPIGVGTGLGLSISIGIVQSFGGSLVYDETSPNCKFEIRLPKSA
jgi:PAS domain S-box-containing protein